MTNDGQRLTAASGPPMPPPRVGQGRGVTAGPRSAPSRPTTQNPNIAPVLVKKPPPFSVRMTQLFWILSFAVGGFTAVYFFIIRKEQLPLIADRARSVVEGRSEEAYETASDIVFWIVFGVTIAMLLVQVTLLVSFMSRRSHVRWWQLSTFGVQVLLILLLAEWVAIGDRAKPLVLLFPAQAGLVLLALLCSVLPKAIAWSARRHDVRRPEDITSGGGL